MGGGQPEIKPLGNDKLQRLILGQAHEVGLENYRGALAEYKIDTQRSLEMVRIGNSAGIEAIKAVTLINGGAAVAMLAFIGHLVSVRATSPAIIHFAVPLALFVGGVFASVLASGINYLAHGCRLTSLGCEFAGKAARRDGKNELATSKEVWSTRWKWIAMGVNLVVVLLVSLSLYFFARGCYHAYHEFKSGVVTLTEEHPTTSRSLF
jgi:hypothetical protein